MAKGKSSKTSGHTGKGVSFSKALGAPPAGSQRAQKVSDGGKPPGLGRSSGGSAKVGKPGGMNVSYGDLIDIRDLASLERVAKERPPKPGILDKVVKANKLKPR